MAPTFKSGKGARLIFNGADMSQVTDNTELTRTVQALKTTVFQNNDETYISGLREATAKYDGLFDGTALSTASTATTGALDAKFETALAASTQPIVSYGPGGDAIGSRAKLFRQETIAYVGTSPANDVVRYSAGGQISGQLDSGVWLLPLRAYTSTSSTFASVNSGITAGTTAGGVGHFHMTAATTVATFRAKIQHSSAGVSWADLISFSSSTGTTSAGAAQRSTVSGTVKRYVRATVGTFTGGSSKSATVAVAFARRGNRKL